MTRAASEGQCLSSLLPIESRDIQDPSSACRCDNCKKSLGQYCAAGCVFTYNYKHPDGRLEYGGYSNYHVSAACAQARR